MRTEVTDEGLLIPKRFLEGVKKVEIRKSDGVVVVVIPLHSEDPILQLGQDPIDEDVSNASVEHDQYIYQR
jgi:virulence-associated protein VagC